LQTQMHYGGYHPTQIQQEGSRLQMVSAFRNVVRMHPYGHACSS
jgi:hypothetical protein